ncbi:MAG: protein kinase, partial [marine benthic group bacterium]|nr:protein kinase [Candidatus Benthicola marisminoris]
MVGADAMDVGDAFLEAVRTELSPGLELVRVLGGGRLSTVFLAREPSLRRLVAVKVLRPEAVRRTKAMSRFRREARSLARVSHPNVVSIFRVGDLTGQTPYLVMQYVRGSDLAERLKQAATLPVPEACSLLGSIASALSAVHSHEIVHRDVRPESILCAQDGRVLLADFGLAAYLATTEEGEERITTAGHIVTDLTYSAPEFFRGEDPTTASDLYSLGVLAYRVLTGSGPHDETTVTGRVHAQIRKPPDRLSSRAVKAPDELQAILDACLQKVPSDRPAAVETAAAFEALARDLTSSRAGTPPTTGGREPFPATDVPVLRVLGGLALVDARGVVDRALLGQPKRVALLTYLALGTEGDFKRRDSLIGIFWPEAAPDSARHSLRQALYILRRAIGADAIRTRGDGEVGVDPGVLACDAARFESLSRRDPRAAVEQYRGDLLPGFYVDDSPEFEHWLSVQRLRLRQLAARAWWQVSDLAMEEGSVSEAGRAARQAVDLDPFDETALHRLIKRLDGLGDRAGALSAFEHFTHRLRDEYAADPSPETVQL